MLFGGCLLYTSVDLPGYGYAKVSQNEKQRWAKLMQGYFDAERNVALVIQILDMRHEPTADDFDMINFLIERDLPFLVVCTKSDKLNKTQFNTQNAYFEDLFREHEIPFIPYSCLLYTSTNSTWLRSNGRSM